MKDNYMHSDMDIIYITDSIPGPSERNLEYNILLGNYNSQMLHNCYCGKNCVKYECECLKISQGDNYNRYLTNSGSSDHTIIKQKTILKDYPIIECNSNCTCSATCGNRVVQNGPIEGLIVKTCDNKDKGLGLFAPHCIMKDTFICEYAGELLTKTEALRRTKENDAQGKMNYIFCLNEHTHAEGFIQTFVDPSKFGNIGRYINHSCEPNSCVVPVRCEIAIPRLAIFATCNIPSGQEITFSYGSANENNVETGEAAGKKKNCLCGSTNCKGYMPFDNY